jgi:NtrC-family two-component system response regulator AlgB
MASSTTQLQPARMQHAAADLNTAHGAHGMNASITTPVADTESPAPRTVQKPRILVVDDDRALCSHMMTDLQRLGSHVDVAGTPDAAMSYLRTQVYDMAFCDLRIGGFNGLELVPQLLAISPNLHIVIITAFASYETAVQAMRAGASNYLPKPFTQTQVRELVAHAHETLRVARNLSTFEQHGGRLAVDTTSESPAMRQALDLIVRVAQSDIPLLLRGENGTGKSVFAELMHRQSARKAAPFVTVNCPSLSDELLMSDLFGHVKGAFTGAVADQKGKVAVAEGGTLFLDELGDLSQAVQAKLLRFLQEQRYERLGDTVTRQSDVRIVGATNRDLEALITQGLFREDLLYRLNVVEIHIPPLRERQADIIPLAQSMLAGFAAATSSATRTLSAAAKELMLAYQWPGNVRELRNELQRITVLWPSTVIEPAAFSQRIRGQAVAGPMLGGACTLEAIEAEHIRKILSQTDTFEEAARILDIEPSTLWRKRQRMGL